MTMRLSSIPSGSQIRHRDREWSASSFQDLFDEQPIERFQAGEVIFFDGDPARHVIEVVDGVVRLCKILVDGHRVICGFLATGESVGISQKPRYIYSAEAVTAVRIRRISRHTLEAALETKPALRPHFFSSVCQEMEALQRHMILLSCSNAQERVCAFLVSLMKRYSIGNQAESLIQLPMTRSDIADFLGMSIETVSRNLTKLAKLGVLTEVERFSLRIVKPRLLQELAGSWGMETDHSKIDDWPAPARLSIIKH